MVEGDDVWWMDEILPKMSYNLIYRSHVTVDSRNVNNVNIDNTKRNSCVNSTYITRSFLFFYFFGLCYFEGKINRYIHFVISMNYSK